MVSYLHTFPLIAPIDEKGQAYRGFIQIHQKEYYIEVHLATPSTSTNIYGSQELQYLLSPYQNILQKRLDQCLDIGLLLQDLKDTLENLLPPAFDQTRLKPSSERYAILVNDLNTIGYDRLESMNDAMDELVFKYQDPGNRWHSIKATIPPQFPLQPPKLTLELPTAAHYAPTTSSLSTLLNDAIHTLNQYQHFFDTMDEIDQQTRVLDPTKPSRADTWRRIALGDHCSLQITIQDSIKPTSIPLVRFFGNEKKVLAYQQQWQAFLDAKQWRADHSFITNLTTPLPSLLRSSLDNSADTKDDDMACAICYAYKLDVTDAQETPDTICANQQCNRGFHPSCLYEWLRSNPTTTRSFNILFGNCPYCDSKITIKAIY